jgi:hypothetical protein
MGTLVNPEKLMVFQNHPNPLSPTTTIGYHLPESVFTSQMTTAGSGGFKRAVLKGFDHSDILSTRDACPGLGVRPGWISWAIRAIKAMEHPVV